MAADSRAEQDQADGSPVALTAARVRTLVAAGEGPHLDYKLACHALQGDPAATAELVKDLCALANGSPAEPGAEGVLLVGVANDRMTFHDVRNAKLTDDAVQDLVRTSLFPPPDVRLHDVAFEAEGETYALKAVTVAARPGSIVRIRRDLVGLGKGGLLHRANEVWVRRAATNELASPEDIIALHRREHPPAPARTPHLTLVARPNPEASPADVVTLAVPELPPLAPDARARRIGALLREHPPIDMAMPLPMFGGRPYEACYSAEEIERYEAEAAGYPDACARYVDEADAYARRDARHAYLYLDVVNDGTAAATHVVITLEAPAGVRLTLAPIGGQGLVLDLDRPRPFRPTPPTPPRPDTRAPLAKSPGPELDARRSARARPQAQPDVVRGPTEVPGPDGRFGSRLRYDIARVAHGDPVPLDPVELQFDESALASGREVVLAVAAQADELGEPTLGQIAVRVMRSDAEG